ncbi:hypothetical protein K0504_10345 [Neiella marina]|uniref:Uncharacterized protein n=1 Tax=Neiella holothuriorum TaxID=2870530 RepID=A0ABS7EGF8_9GAMM|nr:hypothetical protein [Neiella holothuriorum]MBW8191436.1 hypothetical protein [Neiella holothuriorum]
MKIHPDDVERALAVAVSSSNSNELGCGLLSATLLTGLKAHRYFPTSLDAQPTITTADFKGQRCLAIQSRATDLKLQPSDNSLVTDVDRSARLFLPPVCMSALINDLDHFTTVDDASQIVMALLKRHGFPRHVSWYRLIEKSAEILRHANFVSAQLYGSEHAACYTAENSAELALRHFEVTSDWLKRIGVDIHWPEPVVSSPNNYVGTQGVVHNEGLRDLVRRCQKRVLQTRARFEQLTSLPNRVDYHNALSAKGYLLMMLGCASRALTKQGVRLCDIDLTERIIRPNNKRTDDKRAIPFAKVSAAAVQDYVDWLHAQQGVIAALVADELSSQRTLFSLVEINGLSITVKPMTMVLLNEYLFGDQTIVNNWTRKTSYTALSDFALSQQLNAFVDHDGAKATVAELLELESMLNRWLSDLVGSDE